MMRERVVDFTDFKWIASTLTKDEDLTEIAAGFDFPPLLVQDSMQAEHLPKLEKHDDITFFVFRFYDRDSTKECTTIQQLTRKLVVLIKKNEILTIQRSDTPLIQHLTHLNFPKKVVSRKSFFILMILKAVAQSYEPAIREGLVDLESFEPEVFDTNAAFSIELNRFYELKKRTSLIRSILDLNHDVFTELEQTLEKDLKSHYQDVQELYEKQFFQLEQIADNLVNLMSLHITLSSHKLNEMSHKNNETMRVLTLFSVFFLPLNFIASIYGMNFEVMPELTWTFGYPAVIGLMFCVALGLMLWFKSKGWLR